MSAEIEQRKFTRKRNTCGICSKIQALPVGRKTRIGFDETMLRIIVCGGRDYDTFDAVYSQLESLPKDTVIVHGAASGADSLAGKAAHLLGLDVETYPAKWVTYGKAAGLIRNKQMLESGVDLVIAFSGGKGTAGMVALARAAGSSVIEVVGEQLGTGDR